MGPYRLQDFVHPEGLAMTYLDELETLIRDTYEEYVGGNATHCTQMLHAIYARLDELETIANEYIEKGL